MVRTLAGPGVSYIQMSGPYMLSTMAVAWAHGPWCKPLRQLTGRGPVIEEKQCLSILTTSYIDAEVRSHRELLTGQGLTFNAQMYNCTMCHHGGLWDLCRSC